MLIYRKDAVLHSYVFGYVCCFAAWVLSLPNGGFLAPRKIKELLYKYKTFGTPRT